MRFFCNICMKESPPYRLPTNYRRNIASLIKEAINPADEKAKNNADSPLYVKYYSDRKKNLPKPFTFSLFIPDAKNEKVQNNHYLTTEKNMLDFHFSSNDYEFIISLYNGLVHMKKFSPFGFPVGLEHFRLERQSPIKSNTARFKTLSPFIVRDIRDKRGSGYLTPDHPDFLHNLKMSVVTMVGHSLSLGNPDMEIKLLQTKPSRVYHYTEVIPVTSAIIEVSACMDALQLMYDVGIGAKRSQGFGMLEVVE